MITITADNKKIKIDWLEFSDGALTCTIDPLITKAKNFISLYVDPITPCKQVLEEISIVKNALAEMLFNWNSIETILYMPYLPYGRADRVFVAGNPNGLNSFLSKLSSMMFTKVILADVHNVKTLGALKNAENNLYKIHFEVKSQISCLTSSISPSLKFNYVVAPDKGAIEKASTVADHFNATLITASKERCISTGKITSIDVDVSFVLPTSNVLICDDICDGGGTFIPLAKKLREKGCGVSLYVTHMIGSKGLDMFKDSVDSIYCFHIVGNYINQSHILKFNDRNQ